MDPPWISCASLLLCCLLARPGQGTSTEGEPRTTSPAEATTTLSRFTPQDTSLSEASVSPSLSGLLKAMIENELQDCDLVLVHDESDEYEKQLTHLLSLGYARRVSDPDFFRIEANDCTR